MRTNIPHIRNTEEVKIDKSDRAIMKLLIEDARMPMVTIARETGLSHDAIKYRIERLKKNGVIKQFTTVLDPEKLGLHVLGDVALSLWNLDEKKFAEFDTFVKRHPYIVSVWTFSGRWDYFIEIYAKDLAQFNEVLNEIKIKFSGIIKDSETLFVMKELKFRLYPNIF